MKNWLKRTSLFEKTHLPRWSYSILFILVILIVSLYYNFDKILLMGPQGPHLWRQIDCLSYTLNYMIENRGFFNPAVNYVGVAGHGEMVTDFPIIFYIVGKIWQVIGQEEWVFRLLVFTIFTLGLTSIFLATRHLLKNLFWAVFATILVFSSPVIAYYSCNFVMNIVAFSFALLGLSSFYWFYRTEKNSWLWVSACFYLLGGLIKIPALMTFVVILFIYLTDTLGIISYKPNRKLFRNWLVQLVPLAMVIGVVALWVLFMSNYNKGNEGMFLAGIYPIWDLTGAEIKVIIDAFLDFWYRQHFHLSLQIASFIAFFWVLFNFRKLSNIERVFIVLLPTGVLLFLLLWFKAMPNHDYYLTNSYALFIIIWILAIRILIVHYPKILRSNIPQIALSLLLLYNIFYCHQEIKNRYWGWWNVNYDKTFAPLIETKPMLAELGITRMDTIVAMADNIPNATLYFLDVKGWSNYGGHMNNMDSTKIELSISSGAKYMVLLDSTWLQRDFIKPFTNQLILEHRGIRIYQLKP